MTAYDAIKASNISLYYRRSSSGRGYIHIYTHSGSCYFSGKNVETGQEFIGKRIPYWMARVLTWICKKFIGESER